MSVRPILFSAPMVRALLDGRKTQTRRILKAEVPEPPDATNVVHEPPRHAAPYLDAYNKTNWWCWWTRDDRPCEQFDAGYAVGDVLWVREAWAQHHPVGVQEGRFSIKGQAGIPGPPSVTYRAIYKADGDPVRVWHCDGFPYRTTSGPRDEAASLHPGVCSEMPGWTPSIHMPRWVSRLTLAVTGVKVERLQDISEADAEAEGIYGHSNEELGCTLYSFDVAGTVGVGDRTAITIKPAGWSKPRHAFMNLWDKVNGAGAWDANPWVVAVTLEVHQQNVDAFLKQREAA